MKHNVSLAALTRPFFSFFILFLFTSCSEEIELRQKNGIAFLDNVNLKVEQVENVPWLVGQEREVEISKGFRFDVTVPQISKKASELLYKVHGVDAFLYRLSKINRGSRQHLGYVAINSRSSSHITKAFSANIYYHAASVSRQFRGFQCPAFDHRKELKDFSIKKKSSNGNIDIYARPKDFIRGEVSRLSFSPLIFSGGSELRGDYLVEVALFNSNSKRLFSNWYPLNQFISVSSEVNKRVKSCIGVKEELKPLPDSRAPRIEDLRIR